MDLHAEITGINYSPLLCKDLNVYILKELNEDLPREGAFKLCYNNHVEYAVCKWSSPKRTRTFPYERLYNTLSYGGKKIAIIPIYKDEGQKGQRDYLAWDTVSMMSLLGIYIIIGYYDKAQKSKLSDNKINNQKYNLNHIEEAFNKLVSYQSDALHWNFDQISNLGELLEKALNAYKKISEACNVSMKSEKYVRKRIEKISENKDAFMNLSRKFAREAQYRESLTTQPKELVNGTKATITIKNYLGGYYYLTADEIVIKENTIDLIEAKHSKRGLLPSIGDIKDGLIKMILFSNLKNVQIDGQSYDYRPVLKLTSGVGFDEGKLKSKMKDFYLRLQMEAQQNGFVLDVS